MSVVARARPPLGLVAAAAVVAALLAGAAVVRLAAEATSRTFTADWVPVLVGTALLLLALLAVPRLPGLSWAAMAVAGAISALEIYGFARLLEALPAAAAADDAARQITIVAGLAFTAAVLVVLGYACRGWRSATRVSRAAIAIVALGVLATIAAVAWSAVGPVGAPAASPGEPPLTPLRVAARIALATFAAGIGLGVARQLAPAATRAWAGMHAEGESAPGNTLWRFLGHLVDELVPARVQRRQEAAEAERARLAADLHAHVLPELRRVAATAASAGLPEHVAVDLRRALEDVEQLMHQRQSIVLEQFGLVAALEWLAERTEERSALRVQLELDGPVPDGPAAVDPRVARAAFRIALLGLDNVVRHAAARTATLRLAADGASLRLTVEDDGVSSPSLQDPAGRGLADMRGAAAESGGTVRFVSGTGVRIDAAWPVGAPARKHAAAPVPLADRTEEPAT